MCLIVFAKNFHPEYKLILLANRDEFYERPTKSAYKRDNGIIGGKDLRAGGMWLGISKTGKLAALTNYRNGFDKRTFELSRGEIVKEFLNSGNTSLEFAEKLRLTKNNFDGYNILLRDSKEFIYYSNIEDRIREISDGINGLSNAFLNTSWFKLEKAKTLFRNEISFENDINYNKLLDLMTNEEKAEMNDLPQTGIPVELEHQLSSMFIRIPNYGTRSTTLVTIDYQNEISFIERSYIEEKKVFTEVKFRT